VVNASVSANGVFGGGISATVFREGEQTDPNNRGTLVNLDEVTPGHFDTMRIPFLGGRDFTDFDRENTTPVVVINQAMANLLWPGQEALGKRFAVVQEPNLLQVIGVVGTTVVGQIGEDPQPIAYFPMRQRYSPFATVVVRTTGNPEALLGTVRTQVQQIDRNLAFTNGQTVQQLLGQGLWPARMGAALLGLFGALALILASIGIYGVLAYSVAQRTREIGVRMALGAKPLDVTRMILGRGMRLSAIGLLAGAALAAGLGALLRSLLFGVTLAAPGIYAGTAAALVLVALLACVIPAQRAARVDPAVALRNE
jgi:putative ABC transport system permease protein